MKYWSWWGVWSSKSVKFLRWRDFNALRRSHPVLELHGAKHSSYLKISFQTKSWSSGSAAEMSNKVAKLKIQISNDQIKKWGPIYQNHMHVASFWSFQTWNSLTLHREGPATFDIHAPAFCRKFEKLIFSSFEFRFRICALLIQFVEQFQSDVWTNGSWTTNFENRKFHETLKLVRGLELQIHKNSSLARFQCLAALAFGIRITWCEAL